jgi:hypothetical protein
VAQHERGLARFDPRTGAVRSFADGLQGNEFNSGAAFRSASGELFFGGIYGFNHFRPEEVRDNPHQPAVVITGLRRLNRREIVGDSGSILERSIVETTSLRIPAGDNVLTFEFAVLDYSAPGKNRYEHRMVGFNDTWIDASDTRTATYTNLPPGSYTFQVRGSNNDGVWNEAGTSLDLRILPPWWRTVWAYSLYSLLFAGLVLGARRYEMNRIRLRHRAEQEYAHARTARSLARAVHARAITLRQRCKANQRPAQSPECAIMTCATCAGASPPPAERTVHRVAHPSCARRARRRGGDSADDSEHASRIYSRRSTPWLPRESGDPAIRARKPARAGTVPARQCEEAPAIRRGLPSCAAQYRQVSSA